MILESFKTSQNYLHLLGYTMSQQWSLLQTVQNDILFLSLVRRFKIVTHSVYKINVSAEAGKEINMGLYLLHYNTKAYHIT